MSQVLNLNNKPDLSQKLFLDNSGRVGIVRHDIIKYPIFAKLADKQRGFFWGPDEVECQPDGRDFRQLNDHEQHIFTSNIKRQIVLDSVQGRAPAEVFGPICSNSELEDFIGEWNYFERIHARTYTHIIKQVYSDPDNVLNTIYDNEHVMNCARDISKYYDELHFWNRTAEQNGYHPNTIGRVDPITHKKAIWMAINAANALEGIRFYVSFACSWAFAEQKKMEGNAKLIKLIARDENIHLAATQNLLKILPKDDPDFAKIKKQCAPEVQQLFINVLDQEIEWAEYLFKDGTMIGLNAPLLIEYLYWLAVKRMRAIGVVIPNEWPEVGQANPLPWTQKWIGGKDGASVQNAPQETEIESYVIGGTKKDITPDTFRDIEL